MWDMCKRNVLFLDKCVLSHVEVTFPLVDVHSFSPQKDFFCLEERKKVTAKLDLKGDKLKMLCSQMRRLLKRVRVKGEKISVNWVTCHRCVSALCVIPPTPPGGNQAWIKVRVCQCRVEL